MARGGAVDATHEYRSMDCRIESGVRVDFHRALRAQGVASVLRVFAAGHLEDGRPYFMVEVCAHADAPVRPRRRPWWVMVAVMLVAAGASVALWPAQHPLRIEATAVVQPPAIVRVAPEPARVAAPPTRPPVIVVQPVPTPPPPRARPQRAPTPHDLEPW